MLILVPRHGCTYLLLVLAWIRARQCSKDEAFLARLSSEWKFCQKYSLFYSQYGGNLIQLEQGPFKIHKAKIRLESTILRRLLKKESRYKEYSLSP